MKKTTNYNLNIVPAITDISVREFREAIAGESGNFAMLDMYLAAADIVSCEAETVDNGILLTLIKKDGSELTAVLPYSVNENGGSSGVDGADGFSPIASVEQTETGAIITITDKTQTTSAEVYHGNDGVDGEDGFSPSAKIEQTSDGAIIIIVDKDGTTTAAIKNGQDGDSGQDGVSVTHSWDGTILTIKSASGESSADLVGAPGQNGTDGNDGITPHIGENGNWYLGDQDTGVFAGGTGSGSGSATSVTFDGDTGELTISGGDVSFDEADGNLTIGG